MSEETPDTAAARLIQRHLVFAWWSLLFFALLGVTLESLHAFKVNWYLMDAYRARRLMWTLGHAHGGLLSLVHVAFAATVYLQRDRFQRFGLFASCLLLAASVLLPGGFFLGGCFIYDGDPGLGVWIVPVGALSLLAGVALIALELTPFVMTKFTKNVIVDEKSTGDAER